MQSESRVAQVDNDHIEFLTMRPEGSPFALLERRVIVTAPPELVELARSGDLHLLDELMSLLADPQRAWAAEVLLAAMTGQEAKIVDSFATHPTEWWDALGQTAQARWQSWLDQRRGKLTWDSENQIFVETA